MTQRFALMIRARASWAISYTPPMRLRSTSSVPRRTPFCAARSLFSLGLGLVQTGRVKALLENLDFSRCWKPCEPAYGGLSPSPTPSYGPWASTNAPPCRLGTPRRDQKLTATWPADIQSLALPLYGLGLQVHTLPYYGPWLWEHLHADFNLSRTCSTHQFKRWSRGALLASGVTIGRFGAHSIRRGSAAELARGAIGDVALARVLRHSRPTSSVPYVTAAVHSANTAAAMRSASRPGPDTTHQPAGGGRARHAPPGPPPGGYPPLGDLPV